MLMEKVSGADGVLEVLHGDLDSGQTIRCQWQRRTALCFERAHGGGPFQIAIGGTQ